MAFTIQSYVADPTLITGDIRYAAFVADPTLITGDIRYAAFVADPTQTAVVTSFPSFTADPTLATGNVRLPSFTTDPGTAGWGFLNATATAACRVDFNGVVASALSATGNALTMWNALAETSSSTIISGTVTPGWNAYITATGTAAFTSTASSPTIFWEVVTSTATSTATGAAQRVIEATVIGTAVLNGAVVGTASYQVSATSIAQIISGVQFVQDFWDGWAFNLNTAAASEYENFKFNSFCRIGTNYYGCNDTGIHLLGGDLDGAAQIDSTVTTGTSDLATEQFDGSTIKSIPNAYVSARSPTEMTLTCRVEGAEYTYTFRAPKDAVSQSRVDVGKGLHGTFWQFELKNQNGADFEIDSLTVTPSPTTRRI